MLGPIHGTAGTPAFALVTYTGRVRASLDFHAHSHAHRSIYRRGPRNRYRCPQMLSVSDMPACLGHSTAETTY